MLSEWLAGERLAKPSQHEKTFPKVKSLSWEKTKKTKKGKVLFCVECVRALRTEHGCSQIQGLPSRAVFGHPHNWGAEEFPRSLQGCVNPFWAGVQLLARLLREIQGKWEVKPRFGDFGGRERD